MVAAIIQARMESTRLPGKVLKDVLGKPLLELLIERLKACQTIDEVIIATSVNPADDPIEKLAQKISVKYFRGSEEDVLDRYYQTAKKFKVDYIVRITADCPLVDPQIVDEVVQVFLKSQTTAEPLDYAANVLKPTYPDGIDVEVFSFKMLNKLQESSTQKYQREHVCTYMAEHPEEFRIKNIPYHKDLSMHRWTIDNPEDYELIKAIFEGLYPKKKIFYMDDILKFLDEHPGLRNLNAHLVRNAGFISSLEKQGFSEKEKNEIINNVIHKRKIHEI